MPAYPKLATTPPSIPGPLVPMPDTAKAATVQPLGDGRAMLHLGDMPAGIYASEAEADNAVVTFRRMGVAL